MLEFSPTTKEFVRHIGTGDVYLLSRAHGSGRIVGSAGPLAEDALKHFEAYVCTPGLNSWLQQQGDKLIPMEALLYG